MLFDLVSIGVASARLLCGTELFARAASEAGVAPAAKLNDVPYFNTGDLAAIGERVRNLQAELTSDRLSR